MVKEMMQCNGVLWTCLSHKAHGIMYTHTGSTGNNSICFQFHKSLLSNIILQLQGLLKYCISENTLCIQK